MGEQVEGSKIVAIILILGIPALLIFFGVVDEIRGERFDITSAIFSGYGYSLIGIAIYVVELIVYGYLRRIGKV